MNLKIACVDYQAFEHFDVHGRKGRQNAGEVLLLLLLFFALLGLIAYSRIAFYKRHAPALTESVTIGPVL